MIQSMTPQERLRPKIIQASRKRRIVAGAGTTVQEVNKLLKQLITLNKMMKKMGKMGQKDYRAMVCLGSGYLEYLRVLAIV